MISTGDSNLCNLINYSADIQMNLGYDIQIVATYIRCSITQNTYTTSLIHTHTHTTHLGAVPHCVGGTPQQVGQGTSVLEERVGEKPTPVEGELSQDEKES